MKVCVSATADTMEGLVDPRFGRCFYFIVVDIETMGFEAMSNSSANAMGGAGIQAAQAVIDKGVGAVLTGHVGPNAFQVLNQAGVEVFTGALGTVRQAVEQYKNGQLVQTGDATVGAHSGMRGGRGGGRGRGIERGL